MGQWCSYGINTEEDLYGYENKDGGSEEGIDDDHYDGDDYDDDGGCYL